MIHHKSPQSGDSQLWLEMRRLENSWRAVSDIELALLDEMIAIDPDAGQATISMGNPPTPLPCFPPTPCRLSVTDVRKLIRWLTQVSEDTIKGFQTMVDDAEKLGIEDFTVRLTQYPAYPEGSLEHSDK